MCFHADFITVWDALGCSLSKGGLQWGYPKISLTKSLTVYNFGNTLAIKAIFFSKCSKFNEDVKNIT